MASFYFWRESATAEAPVIRRYSRAWLQARSEEWRQLLTQRADFYHSREHILDISFNPENENGFYFILSLYERKQKAVFNDEGNASLRVVRGDLIRLLTIPYDKELPEQAEDICFDEFHPMRMLPRSMRF